MLTINDIKQYIKKNTDEITQYKLIQLILKNDLYTLIDIIEELCKYNSNKGLAGKFFEKLFKDVFTINHKNIKTITTNGKIEKIYKPIPCSGSHNGDISFLIENEWYIGSSKINILSKSKSTLSVTHSEISAELKKYSNVLNVTKHGLIFTSLPINILELMKSCIETNDVFDLSIVFLDMRKINKQYITKNEIYNSSIKLIDFNMYYVKAQKIIDEYGDVEKVFNTIYINNSPIKLRLRQEEAVTTILKLLQNGNKSVLLNMPCRSGKTIICAEIIKRYFGENYKGKTIVYQCFIPEIYNGVIEDFRKIFSPDKINICTNLDKKIKLCLDKLNVVFLSVQYSYNSSIKVQAKTIYEQTNLFVYDEAHLAYGSEKQQKIINLLPKDCKLILCSATPYTNSLYGKNGYMFDEIDRLNDICNGNMDYYNNPTVISCLFQPETNAIDVQYNSISEMVANPIHLEKTLTSLINTLKKGIKIDGFKNIIRNHFNNKTIFNDEPSIQYPTNIQMICNNCEELALIVKCLQKLENYGVDVDFSCTNKDIMEELSNQIDLKAIDRVNNFFDCFNGRIKFFCTVKQCTIGTTIKKNHAIIMMNDSKSFSNYMQCMGRVRQAFKNNNGKYQHITFFIDPLKERFLQMANTSIASNGNGNFTKNNRELKYLLSTCMEIQYQEINMIDETKLINQMMDAYYSPKCIQHLFDSLTNDIVFKQFGSLKDFTFEFFTKKKNNNVFEPKIKYTNGIDVISIENNNRQDKSIEVSNENRILTEKDIEQAKKLLDMLLSYCSMILITMNIDDLLLVQEKGIVTGINDFLNQPFNNKLLYNVWFPKESYKNSESFSDIINNIDKIIDSTEFINKLNHINNALVKTWGTQEYYALKRIIMENNAIKEFGEVFTPEWLANNMIDLIPQDCLENENSTYLEPCCGSGIFLQLLLERIMKSLENKIPNEIERVNHIITNQLYGVELQEKNYILTLANMCNMVRKIYQKNNVNFDEDKFLTVIKSHLHNGDALTFDYWDKTDFTTIITNPPYQLQVNEQGKGLGAIPLYNKFVEHAIKLNPRYLIMIIPARWFSGGVGLNDFRKKMLSDTRIKNIVDFIDSKICFPNVDINGGICYFLRDNKYNGLCEFSSVTKDGVQKTTRKLNEFNILIRRNEALSIVHKVVSKSNSFLSKDGGCSPQTPFGFLSTFKGTEDKVLPDDCEILSSSGWGYVEKNKIQKGKNFINKFKVLISKLSCEHAGNPDRNSMYRVLSRMEILKPNQICNQSYLIICPTDTYQETENIYTYLRTKFVRFLILQTLSGMNISTNNFQFVPWLDFSKSWTDKELYEKYNLNQKEIDFIEKTIKFME